MHESNAETGAPVHGFEVSRWQRFGHDRLYVRDASGNALGHWDIKTDRCSEDGLDHEAEIRIAVAEWRLAYREPLVDNPDPSMRGFERSIRTADPPDPVETSAVDSLDPRVEMDLATIRAGAAARAQAVAAREAAPVRTFFARALRVHTDERAWRIGADGEELVAARLRKMARKDPRWKFLHAVPVGSRGSDIDHVAIGPAGVFTLNAKHHPGAKVWIGGDTMMVDGHRVPYVRNSRHEAKRAARLLSDKCGWPVAVQALVVPVNAASLTVKKAPQDVAVVPRMQLHKWLLRQPEIWTDAQVEEVYSSARRPSTWQ